jgi:hypothetical protein
VRGCIGDIVDVTMHTSPLRRALLAPLTDMKWTDAERVKAAERTLDAIMKLQQLCCNYVQGLVVAKGDGVPVVRLSKSYLDYGRRLYALNERGTDAFDVENGGSGTLRCAVRAALRDAQPVSLEPANGVLSIDVGCKAPVRVAFEFNFSMEHLNIVQVSLNGGLCSLFVPLRFETMPSKSPAFDAITFGQPIGSGGFGVVYSGELRREHVAIKVMANPEDFEDELRVLEALDKLLNGQAHPNLVDYKGSCIRKVIFWLQVHLSSLFFFKKKLHHFHFLFSRGKDF